MLIVFGLEEDYAWLNEFLFAFAVKQMSAFCVWQGTQSIAFWRQ